MSLSISKRARITNRVPATTGSRVFDMAIHIFLVVLALVMLYPLYYIVIVSISHGSEVMQGNILLFPKKITLVSYGMVFRNEQIPRGFLNSFVYTAVGTLVSLVMTLLCAYPLSRPKFYGRRTITKLVVFTMYFSGGMVPMYLLVLNLNLLDSMWSLILPAAINTYNMILMRSYFEGISESIYEAASIDGAGELKILSQIVLPLSMPIVAVMILYYAIAQWNSFFSALLYLNSKVKYPIQIILRNMVIGGEMAEQASVVGSSSGFEATELTVKYAFITLTILPILLIYPFVQKYFVKGVSLGAVKE